MNIGSDLKLKKIPKEFWSDTRLAIFFFPVWLTLPA